jgi:FkbM family methyltransferase
LLSEVPSLHTFEQNIFKSIGRLLRGRKDLTISHTGNGQIFVSDGKRILAIVSAERTLYYKRGISHRISWLSRKYLLDKISVSQGDLAINFGANIGELALHLAYRGCRVIAIEPDPVALSCLRLNVPDTVHIMPTGLWNSDGDLTFYQKPETADTSAIMSDNLADAPTITIPARKLDTIARDIDGRIRLLVGDAEGGEPEVLEGATETLRRTDFVSVACNPERNGERTIDECTNILKAVGFSVLAVGNYILASRSS